HQLLERRAITPLGQLKHGRFRVRPHCFRDTLHDHVDVERGFRGDLDDFHSRLTVSYSATHGTGPGRAPAHLRPYYCKRWATDYGLDHDNGENKPTFITLRSERIAARRVCPTTPPSPRRRTE